MLTDFSLATFNLFNFIEPPLAFYDIDNIYDSKQWQQKCAWTADLIQQMQVDILGLQEVFSPEPLQALCAQHGLTEFVCSGEAHFDHGVGIAPQVALATRFPIEQSEIIKPNPALIQALALTPSFTFSRPPLKVKIRIPNFSSVWVIVVHLKSPRAAWQADECPLWSEQVLNQQLGEQILGRWGSGLQRSAEAALIYFALIEQLQQDGLPVVLMGDFNSELTHGDLAFLLARSYSGYGLSDPRSLVDKVNAQAPTHYWGAKGSRLDHILLSDHFIPQWPYSLAEVDYVQVWDRHLRFTDARWDRMASDHAPLQVGCLIRY